MIITNRHDKELVFAQILYLFIAPILLLYYRIVPGKFRFIMLCTVALLLFGIIKRSGWTHADLGMRKDFMKDALPYTIFTMLGVAVLLIVSVVTPQIHNQEIYEWWENVRFLLLFIPISVLQEVIFRGILMHLFIKVFSSPLFIIVLNASLFTLIHIIYLNSTIILPLTFIGGIGFAWMYYKYPNLLLISLSHTILNFSAMILGFFIMR